jgi:hypothetical protein
MQNPFQTAMQNGENSAEAVRGALVWRFRASCRINYCAQRLRRRTSHASLWIAMRQKRAYSARCAIQNGASSPGGRPRKRGPVHVRRTIRVGLKK